MSIHIAPKAWPSGSARSRVYMKPWSSIGLMSAVPPFAAAARFIASTASRLSHNKSKHHFARRFWWDGTARKGAPFGMGEQHEVDRFTPHHARSRLIGELRIVLETDRYVESHGRLEVRDRQAHKNRLAHHSFLYLLGCQSPASGAKGASPCLKTIESPPNRHRTVVACSGIPMAANGLNFAPKPKQREVRSGSFVVGPSE